jgi:uncharacterized delta-60 repeat protein
MQSPSITQGRLVSVDAGWMSGMNSVRHPWFLRQDQYRRGVNVVNRGGVIQTRPGFRMRLTLPEGNLQGMIHFLLNKNGRNENHLVFAVDGKIYFAPFPLEQPRSWDEFRLRNLQFDPEVDMVHFAVAEKTVTTAPDQTLQIVPSHNVLMIQDGVTPAAYWDGEESRHLVEAAPNLETPTGTWMTFSGGRLWVARGNILLASDALDPLKFTERVEGEGRGDFSFSRQITGLTSFIGDERNEVVVVFTDERSEIVLSGIRDRAQWATTQGMQSILFPSTGCVAGRSIVFQAGLMWWYSSGGLVASDAAASSNLTSQINYRDAEMAFSKQSLNDDQSMICGVSFENYLLLSMPIGQNLNSETFVLDYSPLSEFASEKIPAWSGVWTGIRPIQWASPVISGKRRVFAASVDYKALSDGSHNHVWEAFMPEREDTFFELGPDFTRVDFTRPIFCEFETRLMGDGHDLKAFQYADINLIEIAGDAYVVADYRGTRGSYKPILCKRIIAPITAVSAGADVPPDQLSILDGLKKQSRRVTTENAQSSDGCPTCESEYSENIDKAFSILIRWCGQMAVESIRLFMEPWAERAEGRCEQDETRVCLVGEDGKNYIYSREEGFVPLEDLYEVGGNAWASTRSSTTTLTCPAGSVTSGPLTVTATSTYRSRISQADADAQSLASAQTAALAQADYLRTIYPCYYDSVQFVTRYCYSVLNEAVTAMVVASDGQIILGGYFWNDKTTPQGKLTAKNSSGGRITTFVAGNGLVFNPSLELSTIHVESVAISSLDQSIFVVGEFSQYDGNSRANIVKLNSDGSIAPVTFGTGFTGGIPKALGIQSSGLPVIGGTFTVFDGLSTSHPLIRLLADGTKDNSFASGTWSRVYHVLIQPDDKVLLLGYSSGKVRVERKLASNGNNDTTFTHYDTTTAEPANHAIARQPDGKLIVSFDNANSGKNLVRLNNDGTVDATFDVGTGLNVAARSALVLSDDSVILAGNFTTYKGVAVPRVIKLNSTGTVVAAFNPGTGPNAAVNAVAANSAGTVLYLAGVFTSYNGDTDNSSRFCRIDSTTAALLTSRNTVNVTGRYRGTISQVDSDTQALALANARALTELPCT